MEDREMEALLGRLLGRMAPLSGADLTRSIEARLPPATDPGPGVGRPSSATSEQVPDDPGRRLLAEAADSSGASEATLWLVSEDGTRLLGTLHTRHAGGRREDMESMSVPVAVSALGQVILSGAAATFGPRDYQDPIVAWTTGIEVEAMAAVPVRVDGRVVGVLSAINPRDGGLFTPADLGELEWKAFLLGLVLTERLRAGSNAILGVGERPSSLGGEG